MTTAGSAPDARGDPQLLGALVQTSYAVVGAVTAVAVRHELSLTLWRVVAILRDRTPTMSELAEHLGVDRSTMTGLVNRAAARGLMDRTEDARDRRSSRVALSDAGHALAHVCAQDLTRELAPLTAKLTATQRRQLTLLLTSLGAVA